MALAVESESFGSAHVVKRLWRNCSWRKRLWRQHRVARDTGLGLAPKVSMQQCSGLLAQHGYIALVASKETWSVPQVKKRNACRSLSRTDLRRGVQLALPLGICGARPGCARIRVTLLAWRAVRQKTMMEYAHRTEKKPERNRAYVLTAHDLFRAMRRS